MHYSLACDQSGTLYDILNDGSLTSRSWATLPDFKHPRLYRVHRAVDKWVIKENGSDVELGFETRENARNFMRYLRWRRVIGPDNYYAPII